MSNRWISKNRRVFNICYHITWIPKYRRKILFDTIEFELKHLLKIKANELNVSIEAMECMPDHIHLFIKCNPTTNIPKLIQQLKGYTSFHLRKKFSYLKRIKALWAPSYFCESIGYISEATVKKYINNQKNH